MIGESQDYADRIRWFTSLVGRKKSLAPLANRLRALGITYRTTTFYQGKTTRWGIAWTFPQASHRHPPGTALTVASPGISQAFLRTANLLTTLGIDYDANFQEHRFEYSATVEKAAGADSKPLPTPGPSLPPASTAQAPKEAKLVLSTAPQGVCLTFHPPNPTLLSTLETMFASS